MRLLARAVATVASTLVLTACAGDAVSGDAGDPGALACHGGRGIAVQVTYAACPVAAADFSASQLTLRSAGFERAYDYGHLVDVVSESWPSELRLGDSFAAEIRGYGGASGCTLGGNPTATVDTTTCVSVAIAATCTCADAGP